MRNLLVGLVLSALLLRGGAGASGWTLSPDPSKSVDVYWANEVKPADGGAFLPTTAAGYARPAEVSRAFLTGAIIRDYSSGTEVTCTSMSNGGVLSGSLVVIVNRFKYILSPQLEKAGLATVAALGTRGLWAIVYCTPELMQQKVQPETLTLYFPPGRTTALPFPLDGLSLNLSVDSSGQFLPVISRR